MYVCACDVTPHKHATQYSTVSVCVCVWGGLCVLCKVRVCVFYACVSEYIFVGGVYVMLCVHGIC